MHEMDLGRKRQEITCMCDAEEDSKIKHCYEIPLYTQLSGKIFKNTKLTISSAGKDSRASELPYIAGEDEK